MVLSTIDELHVASTEQIPGLMRAHQYRALYRLARAYDGGHILEIGCYHGRSALVMALAAPKANIVTMSPDKNHVAAARQNTAGHNVEVVETRSWDYLEADHRTWDMVFVDGDHRLVVRDLPWFDRLRVGGLILFHDYTPREVAVCQAVDALSRHLGRAPEISLVDDDLVGMVGFYRREGEDWITSSGTCAEDATASYRG